MAIQYLAPIQEDFKPVYPKLREIDEKPEIYIKNVNEFALNPVGFFIISGTNGNGKTFTAEALYGKFYHPQGDNMFWNQADLKMKWQGLYAKYGSVENFCDDIVKAPLLVLDDLGTTRPTEAFMEFLYFIIDKRHKLKNTHGTIITTNLNSESMREMFGDAFVSRAASGRKVRHDGPDRRPMLF
jgi:DNA replication protein DnaC